MKFLLHPLLKITDVNADEYRATLCEVWHTEYFCIENDIDHSYRAKRDKQGQFVLDKHGEPITEKIRHVVEAKMPKGWMDKGYDHKIEKIEPVYDPNYKCGYGSGSVIKGSKVICDGIPDSGRLLGERKIRETLYCVEFDDTDLRGFVKYIMEHAFEIEENPYPSRHFCQQELEGGSNINSDNDDNINNNEECVVLWQSWLSHDDYY